MRIIKLVAGVSILFCGSVYLFLENVIKGKCMFINEMKCCCFRPFCTLFRLHWSEQAMGTIVVCFYYILFKNAL